MKEIIFLYPLSFHQWKLEISTASMTMLFTSILGFWTMRLCNYQFCHKSAYSVILNILPLGLLCVFLPFKKYSWYFHIFPCDCYFFGDMKIRVLPLEGFLRVGTDSAKSAAAVLPCKKRLLSTCKLLLSGSEWKNCYLISI